MKYALGNMLNGAGGLNADQLALDLQFAADKTLTARKGPTPVLTRAANATYFGPKIEAFGYVLDFDSFVGGSVRWYTIFDPINGYSIDVYYNGTQWELEYAQEEILYFYAAAGSEWRPDQADWSGSGINVTTSSTFGIIGAANNEPRFDHDPVTLACRGLLIEEGRTNLVFPSDTLTTQTRTVTAVAHTLSFYGTGTVVLSGAHSAIVNGTGAYPSRRSLTFTPTAGSLILTVTGTVQFAQLEAGSFPTSYIPTTTSALARSADVCSIANTSSFWNSAEFTLFINANWVASGFDSYSSNFNITAGFFGARRPNTNQAVAIIRSSGVNADISFGVAGSFTTGSMRMALAHSTGQQAGSLNGATAIQQNSAFVPSSNPPLNIGYSGTSAYINGHVLAIRYYKKRLPNAKLVTLTT